MVHTLIVGINERLLNFLMHFGPILIYQKEYI